MTLEVVDFLLGSSEAVDDNPVPVIAGKRVTYNACCYGVEK